MTDAEDEIQCALALLQTSINKFGSDNQCVLGYKKCTPFTSAIRGHKFLKENGFITATVRVGTFVCPPYRNLAEVIATIHKKPTIYSYTYLCLTLVQYNATLHRALYSVSGTIAPRTAPRTGRRSLPRSASKRAATPRTRVRRHSADVVHVSSSSDEARDSAYESEARDSTSQHASEEIEDEVDVDVDSAEIMNTSDVREGEDSDEDDAMTRVNQSTAEQFSVRGRFELQQQKFVKDFHARGVHNEIMMTIKLFGATIPVPKHTIVFPPLRDLYDASPEQ